MVEIRGNVDTRLRKLQEGVVDGLVLAAAGLVRLDMAPTHADLLVPVFRQGRRVYDPPPLSEIRRRTADQLTGFHGGIKRFANPHQYPVGLERGLFDLKTHLILQARGLERKE